MHTEMASKVFDKLYSLVLLLLPKLDMAILAGCDNEVRPEKKRNIYFHKKQSLGHNGEIKVKNVKM